MAEDQTTQSEPEQAEAGWYPYYGGQRFWDGEAWTEHLAPPPPRHQGPDTFGQFLVTTIAVALGGLLAYIIILVLANQDPNTFFFPIKVLVDAGQTTSFP